MTEYIRGDYPADVLSGDWRAEGRHVPDVPATVDLVIEESESGWCGSIVAIDKRSVALEDRKGKVRHFPFGAGFLIDGQPVRLTPPSHAGAPTRVITASGSIAATDSRARTARASRIFVEGRHDAELIEKVWGDDLRTEGVVVEYLDGVDHLAEELDAHPPTPTRRIGVLVDHLVAGSKETSIVEAIRAGKHGAHLLVVGHPYIDVWQAVKPTRLGLTAWPQIPRDTEWKQGICAALGLPHATQADIGRAWKHILGTVHSYADLEPALLGRVEELIDFVTVDGE